jgi:hypothetical protein
VALQGTGREAKAATLLEFFASQKSNIGRKPTKEVFNPAGRHQMIPAATEYIKPLDNAVAL